MKIHLICIILFTICHIIAAQNPLGDRPIIYDRLTDTYLCSVPESWFDDGTIQSLAEKNPSIHFTFLPIVVLEGDFGYNYTKASVSVYIPDEAENQTSMSAKVKWRGGTTNSEDKHKRNYSIKFIDEEGKKQDRRFFSLRNDNHWILDAAQVDLSRIRNRVAMELWDDISTRPYYSEQKPNARTSARGRFVELFLNNEYRGIYCMMECVDRAQLKLKKYSDNEDGTQTIHGQLWKSIHHLYTAFGDYNDYDNTSELWGGFETKYPNLEDVYPTDYSLLYKITQFSTDATNEEFVAQASRYFDIKPTADFMLLIYLLNAIDNCSKNTYWACYDKEESEMITPAVWDMDNSIGQYFDPYDYHSNIVAADKVYEIANWAFYRLDLLNIDGFHDYLTSRYRELRKTHFHPDNLTERYHTYMRMLKKSGAYVREAQRWSGDSDIGGNKLDFDAEAEFIKEWIHRRIEVLDHHRYLADDIRTINYASAEDSCLYNISGQRISNKFHGKGIIIRNGKKYLLR